MSCSATSDSSETCPRARPLIYVASLADYNNGHLHGVWIRADLELSAMRNAINAMLAASSEADGHEWAIHDHDGFGPLRLDESMSLEDVARIAQAIARGVPPRT